MSPLKNYNSKIVQIVRDCLFVDSSLRLSKEDLWNRLLQLNNDCDEDLVDFR